MFQCKVCCGSDVEKDTIRRRDREFWEQKAADL